MTFMFRNASSYTYDKPQPGQIGVRPTQIIPINYTNVSNQLVQNNDNLLENILNKLESLHNENKINLLYLSGHGSTNDNVFMVPDNVWLIFKTPNKEEAINYPRDNYVSEILKYFMIFYKK